MVSFLTLGTEFPLLDFHKNFLCSEKPRPEDEESFLNPILFPFLYLTRHLACVRIPGSEPQNTRDTVNIISDGSKAVARVVEFPICVLMCAVQKPRAARPCQAMPCQMLHTWCSLSPLNGTLCQVIIRIVRSWVWFWIIFKWVFFQAADSWKVTVYIQKYSVYKVISQIHQLQQ